MLPPVRATFVGPAHARYVERAVPSWLEPWVAATWWVDPVADTAYPVLPRRLARTSSRGSADSSWRAR